jgi:anaerobic magnesium-protoporphyrin IX monomethyl ester cyclase
MNSEVQTPRQRLPLADALPTRPTSRARADPGAGAERPRIALVGVEYEENLSLRYLAAAVEAAGFAAVVVPFGPEAVLAVLASAAIVCGISVPFQHRAGELLGFADALRAAGFTGHVVVGGHFATFEYANILRDHTAIDSVARHEGEHTLVELAELVRDEAPVGAVAGLIVRGADGIVVGPKRPLGKLDDLPFPVRPAEPQEVLGVLGTPLIGSRGCYADCSFCCIYAYAENAAGARYRLRSVENVVGEMKEEYTRRGVRLFVFHDDNFFLPSLAKNLERYRRLRDLLRAEGMTDVGLVIKCRPDDVEPELFALLQEMGMIRAYVGIETNSDEGIVSLNRRISPADNARALGVLRDLEVYCSFNVLIFDPEATLDGIARNVDFMESVVDTPFNFCRAEVYAGTPLQKILARDGRLHGDYKAWGYEARSPGVELLFRITTTAFRARNFAPEGVSNVHMALRFDGEVLRRFHPHAWDRALHARLVDLSRRIGEDYVARLREALAFASQVNPADGPGVKAFALALSRHVGRADLAFLGEIRALYREMHGRVARGGPRPAGPFGGAMPVWAAETLRLGTSLGQNLSTERLPEPPPTTAFPAR